MSRRADQPRGEQKRKPANAQAKGDPADYRQPGAGKAGRNDPGSGSEPPSLKGRNLPEGRQGRQGRQEQAGGPLDRESRRKGQDDPG